jgi:hypothetical protein
MRKKGLQQRLAAQSIIHSTLLLVSRDPSLEFIDRRRHQTSKHLKTGGLRGVRSNTIFDVSRANGGMNLKDGGNVLVLSNSLRP